MPNSCPIHARFMHDSCPIDGVLVTDKARSLIGGKPPNFSCSVTLDLDRVVTLDLSRVGAPGQDLPIFLQSTRFLVFSFI